jgi:hypothetical protein
VAVPAVIPPHAPTLGDLRSDDRPVGRESPVLPRRIGAGLGPSRAETVADTLRRDVPRRLIIEHTGRLLKRGPRLPVEPSACEAT